MKYLIILIFVINTFMVAQNTIRGIIIDSETGKPLLKANIVLNRNENLGTATGADGSFTFENVSLGDIIIVTYVGYKTEKHSVSNKDFDSTILIELIPQIIPSQTVLIEGSVGKEGSTPITFNKIKRKEIEESYTVQDIPQFLSYLPSATFYSEGGNGIGYNYLSIRGFDQRRITVSINGIPQNDPEDHNVYWLDFPDLLASTEFIQVQRGAGSGVLGYPAIGGSINIITSVFFQ